MLDKVTIEALSDSPSSVGSASAVGGDVAAGDEVNPNLVPGTNRHKPFRSPHATPYQQSASFMSKLDIDSKEGENAFYGQRSPHYELKHETPAQRNMINMKSQGLTNKEIAARTGFTETTVSNVCRQPWAVKRIADIQANAINEEIAELYSRAKLKSVQFQSQVLEKGLEKLADGTLEITANVVAAAAKEVQERVFGKAKQPYGSEGLADLDFSQKSDEELAAIIMGQSTVTGNS